MQQLLLCVVPMDHLPATAAAVHAVVSGTTSCLMYACKLQKPRNRPTRSCRAHG